MVEETWIPDQVRDDVLDVSDDVLDVRDDVLGVSDDVLRLRMTDWVGGRS